MAAQTHCTAARRPANSAGRDFCCKCPAGGIALQAVGGSVGIDKLEARGLVHRTAHPDDNRRKLVHLTDAGRDAARRAQAILTEPPAELANLDSHDRARLDEILTRLQASRRSTG